MTTQHAVLPHKSHPQPSQPSQVSQVLLVINRILGNIDSRLYTKDRDGLRQDLNELFDVMYQPGTEDVVVGYQVFYDRISDLRSLLRT